MPRPKVRPENRQRAYRACLACKASKIRCDAQHPCGSCLRRDQTSSCTYLGVDRRRRAQNIVPCVLSLPEQAPLWVNITSGPPSPNDFSIPPGTPFSVGPVTPDLSSVADPEIPAPDKERPSNSAFREKGLCTNLKIFFVWEADCHEFQSTWVKTHLCPFFTF